MRHQSPLNWAKICICITALIHLALGFSFEFSVDEAHYALYAQYLDWSYFDHPPLVGWIQWPLIQLTKTEGLIRLIPEVLWVVSLYLVYRVTVGIHHVMQGHRSDYLTNALPSAANCGLMAVLAMSVAPIPNVLAIGLLPDTILTPLSLGLMLMTLRWLQKEPFTIGDWVLAGLLLGLAGLSKYTAIFTAIALLFVFLSTKGKSCFYQPGFWLAMGLSLLLICPVLYWNWSHDWISFKYQIAHGSGNSWAWRRVAAFIGVQIACFGPIMLAGIFFFFKAYGHIRKLYLFALISFFLIPFTVFAALSGGGSLPHWTTPAWFCLAPFVGIGLAKAWSQQRRWIIRSLFLMQFVLCLGGFAYVLSGGITSEAVKSNPIADLYGWKLAGKQANELALSNNVQGIAVQNWTLGSRIAWYAQPAPVFVLDQRQDQFDLWFGQLPAGANVLLVNWSGMSFKPPIGENLAFESCTPIDTLEIKRLGRVLSIFHFSLCSNWQNTDFVN